MNQVVNWLLGCPDVVAASAVRVCIGKESWEGASYITEYVRSPSERAVTDGPDKAGDKYYEKRFYLLGLLPKSFKKKAVYTYESGEWYIIGYYQGQPIEQQKFGKNFIIGEWKTVDYGPYAGWKIDTNETPRQRLPMIVEKLL